MQLRSGTRVPRMSGNNSSSSEQPHHNEANDNSNGSNANAINTSVEAVRSNGQEVVMTNPQTTAPNNNLRNVNGGNSRFIPMYDLPSRFTPQTMT